VISSQIDFSAEIAVAIEVDPVKRRGRQQGFQTHLAGLGEALSEKLACLGLTRGVGQGRGDTANEAGIFLADTDLDPHETLALLACTVNCDRGLSFAGYSYLPVPEMLPETTGAQPVDNVIAPYAIESTTPPSTRSAAPVVAEASGEAT